MNDPFMTIPRTILIARTTSLFERPADGSGFPSGVGVQLLAILDTGGHGESEVGTIT